MATVRDNDTSLWLHNKLGSNESWTSGSISSQLNAEVLRNVKECFVDLQTQVKLKLLLSFFHIPRRNIEEWRLELEEIIEVAQVDSEQWVSMLAEIMRAYASTNCLRTDISEADENARIYYDLVQDLAKELKRTDISFVVPMECHYLNMEVLNQTIKNPKLQGNHFIVKKKPKSGILRSELVVKATELAEHSAKKIPAPTIPLRTRGMPRKMTDTTPLKGLPSTLLNKSAPAPVQGRASLRPVPEKKGGIKVLDINEQPIGHGLTKRRKKTLDADEKKNSQSEEISSQTNAETPDYALALATGKPPTPPPPTPLAPIRAPPTPASYPTPPTPQAFVSAPPTPLPSFGQPSSIPDGPPPTPNPIPRNEITTAIPNQISHLNTYLPVTPPQSSSPPKKVTTPLPTVQTLTKTVILQVANHQPQQIVTLSKELMEQAQDIFRTSNRATRPEKEHILKFMAGTRDNPCPELGNIVTIKLSEQQEPVRQSDGTILPLCVETHFQMNYNTGEWKVITKPPKLDSSHSHQVVI